MVAPAFHRNYEEKSRALERKRVRLIYTSDPYTKIRKGTMGTIDFVDDVGTIHVAWDDGHSLGLIPGEDQFQILK